MGIFVAPPKIAFSINGSEFTLGDFIIRLGSCEIKGSILANIIILEVEYLPNANLLMTGDLIKAFVFDYIDRDFQVLNVSIAFCL